MPIMIIDNHENAISLKTSSPHIQALGEPFYASARNTLSFSKLSELSHQAAQIAEPSLYGMYASELDYKAALSLMLQSTLETRHRGLFFKRIVLPRLVNSRALLDIGPGDGQLTRWLVRSFQSTTLIESNKHIFDALNIPGRKNYQINKICGSVLDVELPNNQYDLGLLSHVLYYFKKNEWLSVINKIYKTLSPGGILAIALSGDAYGKARLIEHFGGENIEVNHLANQCAILYGAHNVRCYALKENIIALDLILMRHICGFFLYDASATASKSLLTQYIENNFYSKSGYYCMSTHQKFILISKPR